MYFIRPSLWKMSKPLTCTAQNSLSNHHIIYCWFSLMWPPAIFFQKQTNKQSSIPRRLVCDTNTTSFPGFSLSPFLKMREPWEWGWPQHGRHFFLSRDTKMATVTSQKQRKDALQFFLPISWFTQLASLQDFSLIFTFSKMLTCLCNILFLYTCMVVFWCCPPLHHCINNNKNFIINTLISISWKHKKLV